MDYQLIVPLFHFLFYFNVGNVLFHFLPFVKFKWISLCFLLVEKERLYITIFSEVLHTAYVYEMIKMHKPLIYLVSFCLFAIFCTSKWVKYHLAKCSPQVSWQKLLDPVINHLNVLIVICDLGHYWLYFLYHMCPIGYLAVTYINRHFSSIDSSEIVIRSWAVNSNWGC